MGHRIVWQNARNPESPRRRIDPQLCDTPFLAPNRSSARLDPPPSRQLRTQSLGCVNPRFPRLGFVCGFPNAVPAGSINPCDVLAPKPPVRIAMPDFTETG